MWERLRAAFTENLNLKLVSFVFAVVLYSLVHGGQDARRSIVVDLDVVLPPESSDVVLVSSLPPSVRVAMRGSSNTIDNLRAAQVTVALDLSSPQPPSHVVFEPRMVRAPDGVKVEVEGFDPPSIDLKWEPRVVRDVPIQVSVIGTPASGFVVRGPLVAEPKTAKVRGPQSEVMVLQHLRADAFDVTGLSEGAYPRRLALETPSGRVRFEPKSVLVTAEITREVAERVFPKVPVVVVGQPKARTQPADVDVRLVCPPELVRSLRPEQLVPQVDVTSKDASGSVALPVQVHIDRCEAFVIPREVVARW